MLRLPAEPFTSTHAVLYPRERGFVLKPPGFGNLKCSPQMRIGGPQPENRVLVCKILYWQFPDFIERHCRIGEEIAAGVFPRRVGHDHLERAGWQLRRRRFQLLGLLEHREPAEGTGDFSASVHLLHQVVVLFRFLFSRLNHRLGAFNGGPADTQVPGDVVAGVTGVGPLTFRRCGGMTEVRPAAFALAGRAPLCGLDGPLQRNDFAGQQILADEVFVGLAAGGLEQIHYGHRNRPPVPIGGSGRTRPRCRRRIRRTGSHRRPARPPSGTRPSGCRANGTERTPSGLLPPPATARAANGCADRRSVAAWRYIPSNSFLASSNFTSCRRLALISSSISAISAFSLSACSRTTSTGDFFFHGLRPSGLAGAGFDSVVFGAGMFFLLLVEFLQLLVDPVFEHPDGSAFGRKLDVGVGGVNFRAG